VLVVMVGLPASGKSTYAAANFRHVVSPDALRLELSGRAFDRRVEEDVWAIAFDRLAELLEDGAIACFDATSLTRHRRRKLVALARRAGAPAVAIYVAIPPEIAWARNSARPRPVPERSFEQMVEALEPPSQEEGFAAVHVVIVR
jgi:predicted kinase